MQAKRFADQQILAILKEGEPPDNKITDVCRKHSIADKAYYQWRKSYGGVENASALRELKSLRDENARLKKLLASIIYEVEIYTLGYKLLIYSRIFWLRVKIAKQAIKRGDEDMNAIYDEQNKDLHQLGKNKTLQKLQKFGNDFKQ